MRKFPENFMYQTVDQMVETAVNGDDVIFVVDEGINTLSITVTEKKIQGRRMYGQEGGRRKCHGADGNII